MDFQIYEASKPFKIKIQNSIVTCDDENAPKEFIELLDLIKASEDNEVFLRELGF
jgi:hypothetical protein